jgi:predicted nucleic acid-binding protein
VEKSVSKTIFVDTLFVVAAINPRDQYHRRAAELVKRFRGHPLLITDAVLLEIGNALARNFKKEAVEIIERFLNSNQVEVVALTPELFREALAMYRTYHDKEWGLVDCVSFVVMRRKNVTSALTFDQHFVQAGFQALMR